MKILIVTINSQYTHFALAPWYLKVALENNGHICEIVDYTINQQRDDILYDILMKEADYICFSVYIWNVSMVRDLIKAIKMANQNIKIVLGGPEVSYNIDKEDDLFNSSDDILKGEGEDLIVRYLKENFSNSVFETVKDLNSIPTPYTEQMLSECKNRMIYYESSRGCPFRCSYCLSSTVTGVRFFDLDRVFDDLKKIIASDVTIVKFVDRTFNIDLERALEIVRFLKRNGKGKTYHFEIVADRLNDELIDELCTSEKGMFQLEIGMQSFNSETLKSIDRNCNIELATRNMKKLLENQNMMIHIDLIVGLPYESYGVFKESFNKLYMIAPHEIQIGFLKILKGTKMEMDAKKYGYAYRAYAPYEVLSNEFISYKEIIELHYFEKIFNRLYNSHQFEKTRKEIEKNHMGDAFSMFENMIPFFEKKNFFKRPFSQKSLMILLYEYGKHIGIDLRDCLVFDYLSNNKGMFKHEYFDKELKVKDKIADSIENYPDILTRFNGKPVKYIMKKIAFDVFSDGVYIFLHDKKDHIMERYDYVKINIIDK